MEGHAATAIRGFVTSPQAPTDDDIGVLAALFAAQQTRVPEHQAAIRQLESKMRAFAQESMRTSAILAQVTHRHPPTVAEFIPRHALLRIAFALVAGAGLALALSPRYSRTLAALAGWDLGGVVLLLLAWLNIATADAAATQHRAASEDPGRTAVYALILLTSGSSLLAAIALAGRAKGSIHAEAHLLIALCLATVAVSWALTHTAFTLRYAHLYYREDAEGVGGVEFPGAAPPSYFDFAYMAFTVGMCFQVSDVAVSSPQIRRGVLLHATLSFVYSTAILAFVLNLIFGLAS